MPQKHQSTQNIEFKLDNFGVPKAFGIVIWCFSGEKRAF